MQTNARMTLATAALLTAEERECLDLSELIWTEAEREQLASLWVWLQGLIPGSVEAAEARRYLLGDAPLCATLSLPAAEFLTWFRCEDWWTFSSDDDPIGTEAGGDAWGWAIVDKARQVCDSLGAMATQVALRVPN